MGEHLLSLRSVPRPYEIQEGFDLPCEEIRVGPADVRLFRFPQGSDVLERTVLMIPGLGASGRSFALQRPLARDYRMLLWTPPLKTPLGTTPLEWNLEVLDAAAEQLPPKFSVVGSSYGSLLALAFAVRFPDRIRSLTLVSPVASTRRIRRGAAAAATLVRIPLPFAYVFAPIVARALGGRSLTRAGRAEIIREARRISPMEMARRLRDVLAADLLPQLHAVTAPTLLVHGRRDLIVPLAAARDVAERLPHAKLEVIPGAAHLPYMSHPDRFNSVLGAFLGAAHGSGMEARA